MTVTTVTNAVLDAALELVHLGFSVVPVKTDGTKSPALTTWRQYTTAAADAETVRTWFADGDHGLGVVTGYGGLEMYELEGRAAAELPALAQLAADSGLGELWQRVTNGWLEMSPSQGYHFHGVIIDGDVPGNTKLARRPSTPEELAAAPGARVQVLAETRGAGGMVVVAPTPGSAHASGRPWVRLVGGPETVARLTSEEAAAFRTLLRTLDDMPVLAPASAPAPGPGARPSDGGRSPLDDFEARTTWDEILTPHGWVHVSTSGRTRYWRRPGKNLGVSATTGRDPDRDRLFVWSTSTEFDAEVPYTKPGAYALFEHGGDHAAAARSLRARGYGDPLAPPPGGDLGGLVAPATSTSTIAAAPVIDGERLALPVDDFARAVANKVLELRIRDEATRLIAREKAGTLVLPDRRNLADVLAEPDDPILWTVDQVMPADAKTLLAAQHKAGKTTLGGNLVRAWVDGAPFLGQFDAEPVGNVVVLDNEMGLRRLRRWYRDLGVEKTTAVDLIDLRGRASTFNILDPDTRSRWAERIAGAQAALVDCLRPFLDALGLDENREAGRFLEALDELMAEAQVPSYVLVHHMGHDGQRSRGDSRILDWPDAIWNLRRATPDDPDDPADDAAVPRFFSAYGRDVDVREGQVEHDTATRTLTYRAGMSRHAARSDARRMALQTAVLKIVGRSPGITSRDIAQALREDGVKFTKGDESPVILDLVQRGLIERRPGERRAQHHFLNTPDIE